jgi:predicted DNA-binding protein (MmcQ/YjbR family)
MHYEEFHAKALSFKAVEVSYPFKGECAWMKVMGKLFAMTNVQHMTMNATTVAPFHFINLKCDPLRSKKLRAEYPAIQAAWHQNKTHWNTLIMDGSLNDTLINELLEHAYQLTTRSLTKKQQLLLNQLVL